MGRMTVIVCIQCLTTSCYHLIEPLKTFLTGMALVMITLSCLAILSAENSSPPIHNSSYSELAWTMKST